jgi:hypothetical protein
MTTVSRLWKGESMAGLLGMWKAASFHWDSHYMVLSCLCSCAAGLSFASINPMDLTYLFFMNIFCFRFYGRDSGLFGSRYAGILSERMHRQAADWLHLPSTGSPLLSASGQTQVPRQFHIRLDTDGVNGLRDSDKNGTILAWTRTQYKIWLAPALRIRIKFQKELDFGRLAWEIYTFVRNFFLFFYENILIHFLVHRY